MTASSPFFWFVLLDMGRKRWSTDCWRNQKTWRQNRKTGANKIRALPKQEEAFTYISVTLSKVSLPFLKGFDRAELKPFPKDTRIVSAKEQEIMEEDVHMMEGTFYIWKHLYSFLLLASLTTAKWKDPQQLYCNKKSLLGAHKTSDWFVEVPSGKLCSNTLGWACPLQQRRATPGLLALAASWCPTSGMAF